PRHRTGDVGIPPDVAVSRPRARHAEEPSAGSGQSSPRGGGAHLSETRSLRRLPSIGLTSRRSLQGDGGAGGLQGLLRLVGGLLVDLLQDGLRRALDEVLGLLQTEAGQAADLLNDLDLLVAGG